jgi:cytochrome c-type biogenesis protein CcmF
MVAAASVLLGTLYPLVLDALGMGKLSVGPPYFEAVFVPLMTPVVFLMGVGALARWKKASAADLARRLKWAVGVSIATAAATPFLMGRWSTMVAFGMLLAAWAITTTIASFVERVRPHSQGSKGWWARTRELPASYVGMVLAHFGIGVFIVGVTLVNGYETEKDVRVEVGQSVDAGGYRFVLAGIEEVQGPNYVAARARIDVLGSDGQLHVALYPEKRIYTVQNMPMTEAAIDSGIFGDIYVALGEQLPGNAWTVRVHTKPFVNWIWVGCLFMSIGGIFAVCDRRYRRFRRADSAYEPVSTGGAQAAHPVGGLARSTQG